MTLGSELPVGWRQTRLKHVAVMAAGGTPRVDNPRYWTEDGDGRAWVAIADVTREPRLQTTSRRVSEEGIRAARLPLGRPGTVLFAMYASLGALAVLDVPATWNQAILGITPRPGTSGDFVRYALVDSRRDLLSLARSNTQANLNQEQVGNLRFSIPGLSVQRRIVEFLDRECERVASSFLMIEQLADAAVEGYLSRARELIVAPDLSCVLVKLVAKPGTGHTPSRNKPEYWIEGTCRLPWFGLADVWQLRDDVADLAYETAERVSEAGLAGSAAVRHPAGTVFLSRTASVGFVGQMAVDMAVTQDFMTWTCGPLILPEYLLHALRASRPEIMQMVQGSTHKTIYMSDLMNLKVPLPPVDVQRRIVDELQPRIEARRRVRPEGESLSDALTAYRSSLIHEAVTGKLDVTKASERQMDERLHAAAEGHLDEVPV